MSSKPAEVIQTTESDESQKENREPDDKLEDLDPELLEILGEQVPDSGEKIKINQGITKWWKNWMSKGLSEEAKKEVVKTYSQNSEFATDPPKVNLEILRHMTDIAKKRDQHFAETQSCVGKALLSLASAFSLITEYPEGDIDQTKLLKYLWDSGKLLSDVYFQQSTARRSFITPILDKELKTTLDASVPNEWLYGDKLSDQIKEAKSIVKAAASLKQPEKSVPKKSQSKNMPQGNFRGPPVNYRQVGNFNQRRQFKNVRYRSKSSTSSPSPRSSREKHQTPNKK